MLANSQFSTSVLSHSSHFLTRNNAEELLIQPFWLKMKSNSQQERGNISIVVADCGKEAKDTELSIQIQGNFFF